MRLLKICLIILSITVFTSCVTKDFKQDLGSTPEEVIKNTPSLDDELIKAIRKEYNSGRKMEKIFLGYKFGMSSLEVEEHSQKLVRENKLKQKHGTYYYNFIFDDDTAETYLNFRYSADQSGLMTIYLPLTANDKGSYLNQVLKKYIRKYILDNNEENKPLYYKTHTIFKNKNPDKNEIFDAYMFVTGSNFISIIDYNSFITTITYLDNRRLERNKEMSRVEADNSKRDENLEDI